SLPILVSRFWCKISVRILWRDIWSNRYRYPVTKDHMLKVDSAILSTLISCLPNESKELLLKNEIIYISIPTSKSPLSKSPLFNYASFCKVLLISEICQIIDEDKSIISLSYLIDKKYLISKEMLKMF